MTDRDPFQVIGQHAQELMEGSAAVWPDGAQVREIVTVVEWVSPAVDPLSGETIEDGWQSGTTVYSTTGRPHVKAAVLKLGLNAIADDSGDRYVGGRSF